MLNVQKYLTDKTVDDLNKEFGINATYHSELPLVLLNYDQIESKPKTHPIVRECRALVLNTEDFSLVAKTFNRFFNHGEVADEPFDFNNCIVTDKEDGSLLLIYWFRDRWMAHTRGSFNMENSLYGTAYTWRQLILEAIGVSSLDELSLRKDITYVCELCSLHNKIVRKYPKPTAYLLSAFKGVDELHWDEVDTLLPAHNIVRVGRHHFKSLEEIMAHIKKYEELDPTYEGVVSQDINGRRKLKSETYYALHHMAGNGNLFHPKYLLPFIMSGEQSELLTYYPEVEDALRQYEKIVQDAYDQLVLVWKEFCKIEDQKQFALAIQGKSPFSNLLFRLKKEHGVNQEERHLKEAWRNNEDQILKVLFKSITLPEQVG